MVTRWFVEIDPHCRNVLARHWPGLPIYEDISAVDWSAVESIDVLAGGFPCQPVSAAGRQLAQADSRWLWPAFADAIRALRPKYIIVENVAGLRQRGLGIVIGDLAALGYDAEWDGIPAAAVGADHVRDRLLLVAYSNGSGLEGVYEARGGIDMQSASRSLRRHWSAEPDVDRVAHGIPHRVDRLRALGNAVVPQVAEWVGRRVIAFDENRGSVTEGSNAVTADASAA